VWGASISEALQGVRFVYVVQRWSYNGFTLPLLVENVKFSVYVMNVPVDNRIHG